MSKIFVSDLDGTLLRNNSRLSDYSRKNLEILLAKDLPFSIATARSVVTVRNVLGDLPLRLPIICSNGAYITDFHSGERMFINSLNPSIVHEIVHLIKSLNASMFVSTFDGIDDQLYIEPIKNEGMAWYKANREANKDPRLKSIKNVLNHLNEPVISINIINKMELLDEIKAELEQKYGKQIITYVYDIPEVPGWNWLSVFDAKATKAGAIIRMIEELGYVSDHLTVFGDHLNDISMFKLAGRGVATGNAREELKSMASEIIGTNETDSVVKYLLRVSSHL